MSEIKPVAQLTDAEFDAAAEGFDLDEFVNGATPKTRQVRIFRDGELLGELDRLQDEKRRLQLTRRKSFNAVSDPSDEVDRELRTVAKTLYDNSHMAKVRGLAPDRVDELTKAAAKAKRPDGKQLPKSEKNRLTTAHLLQEALVYPKFASPDRVLQYIDAIGEGQLQQIADAFHDASRLPFQVDIPFSLVSSEDEEPDT